MSIRSNVVRLAGGRKEWELGRTMGGPIMRRTLTLFVTTAFALSLASAAGAATGGAPYTADAKGNCHDSAGKMAKKSMCAVPAATTKVATATATPATSGKKPPNCTKGKLCGNSCIKT